MHRQIPLNYNRLEYAEQTASLFISLFCYSVYSVAALKLKKITFFLLFAVQHNSSGQRSSSSFGGTTQ